MFNRYATDKKIQYSVQMKTLMIRRTHHTAIRELYTQNGLVTEIQIQVSGEDFKRINKFKWQLSAGNKVVRKGDQQTLLKFLQYGREYSTVTFLDGNRFNFQRANLKYYP